MKLLKVFILICITQIANAKQYKYEVRKIDSHIIHVVILSPKDYEIEFIKAHGQVFGRETVKQIAERENADIAINGGFFEIGGSRDGMPSRVMLKDGKIFSLVAEVQDNLILLDNKLSIKSQSFDFSAYIGNKQILINKYNKFPDIDDVVLFSDTYGNTTLTNFNNRCEIAFNKDYKLIKVYNHGNAIIPREGFILSVPKSLTKHINELKLASPDSLLKESSKASIITGIPMLISNGIINPIISDKKSDFYEKSHARTALGIRKNGEIVLIVAEYSYTKDLNDVTMNELKEVIQSDKNGIVTKYQKPIKDLTLENLTEIAKTAYATNNSSVGLTMQELANLMLDLKCDSAINLDGGGSSALWVANKIVSQTTGDKDESPGKVVQRPVSDAIIFKKK